MLQKLQDTVFYTLEKSIKTYRQFAQRNIKAQGQEITIDQWLVLKTIHEQPNLSQTQISKIVFKDYASVTRIIELLVKRNYLKRSFHSTDRRRFQLEINDEAEEVFDCLLPVISQNRKQALAGISKEELNQLNNTLQKIISNCQLASVESRAQRN